MAENVTCVIVEGESPNPDNPNPWNVQMRFYTRVMNSSGGFDRQEVRSWAVDAPSELAAKTLKTAIDNMTDATYDGLYDEVTVH